MSYTVSENVPNKVTSECMLSLSFHCTASLFCSVFDVCKEFKYIFISDTPAVQYTVANCHNLQ